MRIFIYYTLIIGLFFLINSEKSAAQNFTDNKWGDFSGELKLEKLRSGNSFLLKVPLKFTDRRGVIWQVPTGFVFEGTSIPRPFWSIIGTPFREKYVRALILHEHYSSTMLRDWRETHRMLYEALRASNVNELEAKTFYASVYSFGPRWNQPDPKSYAEIKTKKALEGAKTDAKILSKFSDDPNAAKKLPIKLQKAY